jgi:hypothetical protein
MLSHEALRQQAQRMPAVTVPSETLLALLDAVEKVKAGTKRVKAAREVNPDDEKCARWLYDVVVVTAPKARAPNFNAWTDEVRLMRERDGRSHKEICALFKFAHADTFWRQNILSPTKLREHWDKLTIKRDTAAQQKSTSCGTWWQTEAGTVAKGAELGVAPYPNESWVNFKARIQAAIENGGVPPAPPVRVRVPDQVASTPEPRGRKPEGLDLKALLRVLQMGEPHGAAQCLDREAAAKNRTGVICNTRE